MSSLCARRRTAVLAMSAPSPSSLLLGRKTVVKASSTLNRSAEYAASNALDGKEDTCWNSDQVSTLCCIPRCIAAVCIFLCCNPLQGSSQWLLLHFKRRVTVQSVSIVFQGGFVGQVSKRCAAFSLR